MKPIEIFVGFIAVLLMSMLAVNVLATMDAARTRQGDLNRAWEAQHGN